MDKTYINIIVAELNVKVWQVEKTIELLNEDNTIPFLARYRKEMTGSLDEDQLRVIEQHLDYYKKLDERKKTILATIDKQEKLTPELKELIENTYDATALEDIYLPYKPKKRTRGMIAREKGLEALSELIFKGDYKHSLEELASPYLNDKVKDIDEALQGASDILAEKYSEKPGLRAYVRQRAFDEALIISKAKNADESSDFDMYYDFSERVAKIPSHRILAMNRGEQKGILKVKLDVEAKAFLLTLNKRNIPDNHPYTDFLKNTLEDAFKRLIFPAIEREIRNTITESAEVSAIQIFSKNLFQLLMQPPVRGKVIMGIDPGFRSGCKVAVIDETGKYLEGATIYPTPPKSDKKGAQIVVKNLVLKYNVEIVAVGNGTASRETVEFIAELIEKEELGLKYTVVSEAGASVYSASPIAKEEFPDLEASTRGNISIARRLQDPLAELVKIDPKSIGVGQYQHDVNQKELASELNHVIQIAVNQVGVDVNTASGSLLQNVSGLSKTQAKNIKAYREEFGAIKSRLALKKIKGIGAKAFEQAAGFLKIYDGDDFLDRTNVHPESYAATKKLFKLIDLPLNEDAATELKYLVDSSKINIPELAETLDIGNITLNDIISALIRPDRDPREDMPPVLFKEGILKIEDLKEGMKVKGTIQNVTDFGAFVDIGLKQAGLVHISKLAKHFVKNPMDVVKVGQIVEATVISIDTNRGRIGLSLID